MTDLQLAIGSLEELHATLMLEYHNKNWLIHGTEPAILNKEQRNLCNNIISNLKKIKILNTSLNIKAKISSYVNKIEMECDMDSVRNHRDIINDLRKLIF